MSNGQARKDRAHGNRKAASCARCKRQMRNPGKYVPGIGALCPRCLPAVDQADALRAAATALKRVKD